MIYLRGHHLNLLHSYLTVYGRKTSLENKKNRIIKSAIDSGHSRKHGKQIIDVLERIINSSEHVKLTDRLDDICSSCNDKRKKICKEFIPYGISAASDDRATIHYYGLQKRTYRPNTLINKISKKNRLF